MFVKCPLCDKHYAKSWGSRNKENRKKKSSILGTCTFHWVRISKKQDEYVSYIIY